MGAQQAETGMSVWQKHPTVGCECGAGESAGAEGAWYLNVERAKALQVYLFMLD